MAVALQHQLDELGAGQFFALLEAARWLEVGCGQPVEFDLHNEAQQVATGTHTAIRQHGGGQSDTKCGAGGRGLVSVSY